MPTPKELALTASDDAFREAIKMAISTLTSHYILAKTDDERRECLDRHKDGLRLCKKLHEASIAAISETLS